MDIPQPLMDSQANLQDLRQSFKSPQRKVTSADVEGLEVTPPANPNSNSPFSVVKRKADSMVNAQSYDYWRLASRYFYRWKQCGISLVKDGDVDKQEWAKNWNRLKKLPNVGLMNLNCFKLFSNYSDWIAVHMNHYKTRKEMTSLMMKGEDVYRKNWRAIWNKLGHSTYSYNRISSGKKRPISPILNKRTEAIKVPCSKKRKMNHNINSEEEQEAIQRAMQESMKEKERRISQQQQYEQQYQRAMEESMRMNNYNHNYPALNTVHGVTGYPGFGYHYNYPSSFIAPNNMPPSITATHSHQIYGNANNHNSRISFAAHPEPNKLLNISHSNISGSNTHIEPNKSIHIEKTNISQSDSRGDDIEEYEHKQQSSNPLEILNKEYSFKSKANTKGTIIKSNKKSKKKTTKKRKMLSIEQSQLSVKSALKKLMNGDVSFKKLTLKNRSIIGIGIMNIIRENGECKEYAIDQRDDIRDTLVAIGGGKKGSYYVCGFGVDERIKNEANGYTADTEIIKLIKECIENSDLEKRNIIKAIMEDFKKSMTPKTD